ncbi:MAG: winged helix-turn-helix domain-containing protein [Pirellulales bacterium]
MTLAPHLSVAELHQRYREAEDPVARSQWQMVWLLAGGTPTAQVAAMTGYTVRWVQEIARRYRAGPAAVGDRRHTNPGAVPLLNGEQQEQLRQALGGPAPDGGVWSCRSVASWMSQTLGRPVSAQRGWEWMRRLGFTPQRPRPRETRADPAAQTAFKKGGSPSRSPR